MKPEVTVSGLVLLLPGAHGLCISELSLLGYGFSISDLSGVSFDLWSSLASILVADFSDLPFGQVETADWSLAQNIVSSIYEMEMKCCKYTEHTKKRGKVQKNEERSCLRNACPVEKNREEMRAGTQADLCWNIEVRIKRFSLWQKLTGDAPGEPIYQKQSSGERSFEMTVCIIRDHKPKWLEQSNRLTLRENSACL